MKERCRFAWVKAEKQKSGDVSSYFFTWWKAERELAKEESYGAVVYLEPFYLRRSSFSGGFRHTRSADFMVFAPKPDGHK